jgi:hypothetical protein
VVEQWSDGALEGWSVGVLEWWREKFGSHPNFLIPLCNL